MKTLGKYLKIFIAMLAILNLMALFVFQYDFSFLEKFLFISGLPFDNQLEHKEEETEDVETSAPDWFFQFETDTLTYDGTSELDLLEGVTLVNTLGQFSDEEIFVRITTGSNVSSKIIEYSADTEDGRVVGTRNLQLMNYQGPSIVVNEAITSIETTDVNNISTLLITSGSLTATDGFNLDISEAVTATYTRDTENLTLIHCSFTITNMFNDTKTVNKDITLTLTKPLIVLTESSVTIKVGERFDAASYIEAAINIDGTSLRDRITIEGNVDVNTPGTYEVKYFTYNYSWDYSFPQILVVTVVE